MSRATRADGRRRQRRETTFYNLSHNPVLRRPIEAAAHWRLGAIHEAQAQRRAARTADQTALRLDPKLKGAREALERIK